MSSSIFFIKNNSGLTLVKNGKQNLISSDHPNYTKIISALKSKKYDEVENLMNITNIINKTGTSTKTNRKVFVRDGSVFYTTKDKTEKELHGTLVDRILADLKNLHNLNYADSLLNLLDNIMKNKVKDIRSELYDWLMAGKSPITYDGCFLAYKKVRENFFDIYSNKMDNSPGKIVRINQELVDLDRKNTCSTGLHFCSNGYLEHFGSCENDRIIIVKVNPKHVFAIPVDYSFQKGRASEYFVVGEYSGSIKDEAFKGSFINEDNKKSIAPKVNFSGWLKPSLETLATSYNLLVDGKASIINYHGKNVPVVLAGTTWLDISGKKICEVWEVDAKEMSFQTKSVRKLIKETINSFESKVKK